MGLFNIFKRHKKDDGLGEGMADLDTGFDDSKFGANEGQQGMQADMNLGFKDDMTPQMPGPANSNFDRQSLSQQYSGGSTMSKDLELINAKLDNIKSMLESLGHRIGNLENETMQNQQQGQQAQQYFRQRYRG